MLFKRKLSKSEQLHFAEQILAHIIVRLPVLLLSDIMGDLLGDIISIGDIVRGGDLVDKLEVSLEGLLYILVIVEDVLLKFGQLFLVSLIVQSLVLLQEDLIREDDAHDVIGIVVVVKLRRERGDGLIRQSVARSHHQLLRVVVGVVLDLRQEFQVVE